MAFVEMKNAKLTDNDQIDFTKTKTVRLASEKIGKDLYRQIYLVEFTQKNAQKLDAISLIKASSDECAITGVRVFVDSSQSLGELR